jgi:predicted AAA+ superfamily ATPase
LRYPRKYYCVDNGLRNAVSFRVSADTGRLCENLAAVELKRRGKEVYYWKDAEHHEVDFVVREGLAVAELIQVCADPSDPVIMKRELRALAKAGEELRCRRLRVLTQDFEQEKVLALRGRRTRVKFQPLWKWLIESQIPR